MRPAKNDYANLIEVNVIEWLNFVSYVSYRNICALMSFFLCWLVGCLLACSTNTARTLQSAQCSFAYSPCCGLHRHWYGWCAWCMNVCVRVRVCECVCRQTQSETEKSDRETREKERTNKNRAAIFDGFLWCWLNGWADAFNGAFNNVIYRLWCGVPIGKICTDYI